MRDQQEVLMQPFDVNIHKETFINYLEVVILPNGTISYAVPSHQEQLIYLACQKHSMTRQALEDACPREYYFDFMTWLCHMSECVSVWNDRYMGQANEAQTAALLMLKEEGLYKGVILHETL